MTTGNNKHEQWSAEPIKFSSDNPCNHQRPTFPRLLCNRDANHKGDHCNKRQAGIAIVETWWER